MADRGICAANGCCKPVRRRIWCGAHYEKFLKYGDPLGGVRSNAAPGEPLAFIDEHIGTSSRDCIIWPFGCFANGYGSVFFEGKNVGAHVVSCEKAHGKRPHEDYEAAHSCGTRPCINEHHLRWATKPENAADRLVHGTDNRGERHSMSKLTEADVLEIRQSAGKIDAQEFSELHGVTREAIYMARNRKSWAWLE